MTKSPSISRAFSLIELLIALAILGVVAAIVIPRYIGLQDNIKEVIAKQIADELTRTYANWKASGGIEVPMGTGGTPLTSSILQVICSEPGTDKTVTDAYFKIADKDGSNHIRVGMPLGLDLLALQAQPAASLVLAGQWAIASDGSQFTVIPKKVIDNAQWNTLASNVNFPWQVRGSTLPLRFTVSGQTIDCGATLALEPLIAGSIYGVSNGNIYRIDYTCSPPLSGVFVGTKGTLSVVGN